MKLTEGIRDHIKKQLLADLFNAGKEAIDVKKKALGDDFLALQSTDQDRERWGKAPKGDYPVITYFRGQLCGSYDYFYLTDPQVVSYAIANAGALIVIDLGKERELATRYRDIKQEQDKWESDRGGMAMKITAALKATTTTDRLIAAWPELQKYIPVTPASLPAVIINDVREEVNAILDEHGEQTTV